MELIDDSDVPETGAAFTFGKSKFADNNPGKFWIRNDLILQVACGDEHTAILTASGRVFTFGNNEWGQLGHGHTKCLTKPSCIKALKQERAVLLACGRSHTLVATDIRNIYGFGTNAEGQLGSSKEYTCHYAPVRIQGLEDLTIKMLAGGVDHSMALTDKGIVYVWGSNSEGQIGLDMPDCFPPIELKFDMSVICISAGYYHSAFVTVDGKLYTCGETESGKLGHPESSVSKVFIPRQVPGISGKVVWVSCGGNHTVAVTADGKVYSFGNGFNGQLGLGPRILEAYSAHQIESLKDVRVARVSCGENHTSFIADSGHLYICGDKRHGKLGLLDDDDDFSCGQFIPTLVKRFQNFQVQQVACGGCHTLVLAMKKKSPVKSPSTLCFEDGDICRMRDKKQSSDKKLPPLRDSWSSLPCKTNVETVSPVKTLSRVRLPSISKSPVWYVPLERVADEKKSNEKNSNGTGGDDDDDEILSKLEQRCSILSAIEAEIIRHVDSDVESDSSEVSDFNKTHTLVNVDNTVAIVRPVVSDESVKHSGDSFTLDAMKDVSNQIWPDENLGSAASEEKSAAKSEFFINYDSDSLNNTGFNDENVTSEKANSSVNKGEANKSQFYDGVDNMDNCSKSSKSSKACVML